MSYSPIDENKEKIVIERLEQKKRELESEIDNINDIIIVIRGWC